MKRILALAVIIATMLTLVGCGVTVVRYKDADEYTAGAADVTDGITELEIEWIAGDVKLGVHDGEGILVGEVGDCVDEYPLYYRVKGGELSIKYAKSGENVKSVFGKELTVLLPAGHLLSSLKISSASGDIDLDGISSLRAELSSASGDVTVKDSRAEKVLDASTASGKITVELLGKCEDVELSSASGDINAKLAEAGDISVSTASGSITLTASKLPSEIGADSASGNVTVYLPEDAAFSFEAESASGRVSCEFAASKKGDTYTVGGGRTDYTFDTASGNIYVNKIK